MQKPPLEVRREGARGTPVVLFHGGAGPELTWSRQLELSDRWQLFIPWRRGFGPSPAVERQDWEIDARDLLDVMPPRAHVVAHSIGGVAATVAAAQEPQRFSSLTLIEPPLWFVAEGDPEVRHLAALSRAFVDGEDAEARERFLRLAGLPHGHPDTVRTERLARALRDPGEARPDLRAIRHAGIAVAIVSGDHHRGLECVCDALAASLEAERVVLRGAGHAVARAPGFNAWLESFLSEQRTRMARITSTSAEGEP